MTATVKPLHTRRTPGIKTKRALQSAVDCRTPPPGPVISPPRQSTAGVSSSSGGVGASTRSSGDPIREVAGPLPLGVASASRTLKGKGRGPSQPEVAPGPLSHQPSGKAVVHPGEGNDGASNGPLDPFLVRLGIWWIGIGAPARIALIALSVWLLLGIVAAAR